MGEEAETAWHARGQGFKFPQLHPRSEAQSGLSRSRIARLGQQIGSNLYRHGPIRSSGAAGRGRVPSCPRPVDPGRPRPPAGRSFATKDRIGWAITDCPGGYCADRGLRTSSPTVGAEGMRSSIVAFTRTDQHTLAPMTSLRGIAGPLSGWRLFSPMPAVTDNRVRHHRGPPMTGPNDLPVPGRLMALAITDEASPLALRSTRIV